MLSLLGLPLCWVRCLDPNRAEETSARFGSLNRRVSRRARIRFFASSFSAVTTFTICSNVVKLTPHKRLNSSESKFLAASYLTISSF